MKIFAPTQKLMKVFGYLYTYSDSLWYKCLNYFCCFCTGMLVPPICTFIGKNIYDVVLVAPVVAIELACSCNGLTKCLVFILNRNAIKQLLLDLQRNIDERESLFQIRHYQQLNGLVTLLSKLYISMMIGSVVLLNASPFLFVLYMHFAVGEITPDMWLHPIHLVMPYDTSVTPMYEITYVLCVLTIICVASAALITECFFMGVCSQIIACQKNLQDNLSKLSIYKFSDQRHKDKVHLELTNCIRFHYKILNFQKRFELIYSPIIFFQYLLSILQICGLTFEILVSDNITVDRLIFNIITCTVFLTELLIYCYFGNEVTYQGTQISDCAYNSAWHCFTPKLKKYILNIMIRSQKPNHIVGFKMISCNLETYMAVINTVGSLLALLQSMT